MGNKTFVSVAKITEIPKGKAKIVEVSGKRIALCNVEGSIYAIDDVCTHDNGPLGEGEMIGHTIECPRHGARFDVRSGKVLCLPAILPVKTYEVKVEKEDVTIAC